MIEADLPQLSNEQELVIYRIAQEALTNVVRHSSSATAIISLTGDSDGHVVLEVRDQGRGFAGASPGSGLRGMRERAALVGATLSIGQSVDGGVDVVLRVPHHAPARAT
jgi:two-component system sensor histidine kinase UhpB